MGLQYQAANLRAPFGDGTTDTNVVLFNATTSSQRHELPTDSTSHKSLYAGKFVKVFADGGNLEFYFTTGSSATIVAGTAAASGTTAATLGTRLKSGDSVHMRLPTIKPDEHLYFVRIADTTMAVEISITSF